MFRVLKEKLLKERNIGQLFFFCLSFILENVSKRIISRHWLEIFPLSSTSLQRITNHLGRRIFLEFHLLLKVFLFL